VFDTCSKNEQVSNANGWGSILHHFDLPEEFPQMQANNSASVALMLSQYYMVILHPFEELYKKNLQEQQKKAQIPQRQGGLSGNSFPGVGRPAPGMPNMEQLGVRQMNANGLMPQNISQRIVQCNTHSCKIKPGLRPPRVFIKPPPLSPTAVCRIQNLSPLPQRWTQISWTRMS
jgi:hypothetical protein